MNREYKFRLWDKINKVMIYPEPFSEKFVIQLGGVLGKFNKNKKYDTVTDNYIIMQYTGLKDKNHKEIYEGDYDQDYNVVHWCSKRNGWAMATYDFPTQDKVFCNCYHCEGHFDIDEILDTMEIKGNIYENPKPSHKQIDGESK